MGCVHFVGFPDNHGRQFQNALRAFGPPAFQADFAATRALAPRTKTFGRWLMTRKPLA